MSNIINLYITEYIYIDKLINELNDLNYTFSTDFPDFVIKKYRNDDEMIILPNGNIKNMPETFGIHIHNNKIIENKEVMTYITKYTPIIINLPDINFHNVLILMKNFHLMEYYCEDEHILKNYNFIRKVSYTTNADEYRLEIYDTDMLKDARIKTELLEYLL